MDQYSVEVCRRDPSVDFALVNFSMYQGCRGTWLMQSTSLRKIIWTLISVFQHSCVESEPSRKLPAAAKSTFRRIRHLLRLQCTQGSIRTPRRSNRNRNCNDEANRKISLNWALKSSSAGSSVLELEWLYQLHVSNLLRCIPERCIADTRPLRIWVSSKEKISKSPEHTKETRKSWFLEWFSNLMGT